MPGIQQRPGSRDVLSWWPADKHVNKGGYIAREYREGVVSSKYGYTPVGWVRVMGGSYGMLAMIGAVMPRRAVREPRPSEVWGGGSGGNRGVVVGGVVCRGGTTG